MAAANSLPLPPPPDDTDVQVDDPANPHGLEHGWLWLSRAANSLPADWLSAKALSCFLRTAGYSLFRRWGRRLGTREEREGVMGWILSIVGEGLRLPD